MPKLVATLSLRAALYHKLEAIVRGFGSVTEGRKQIGCSHREFQGWRAGAYWPSSRYVDKIHDTYLRAVEIINDPRLFKQQREASKKVHALASKLHLSQDTVRLLQKEGLY